MKITCPCCATGFPLEAGLIEADAKRLAAVLADMEPPLARAAISYLRLFKPAKQELRLVRAHALLVELLDMVKAGVVSRDERTGVQRVCTPALWMAGMEQMQQQSQRLELPLKNHHYLRAIVYGLADKADAKAEQQQHRDAQSRSGHSSGPQVAALDEETIHRQWLKQQLDRGLMTTEQCEANLAEYRQKRKERMQREAAALQADKCSQDVKS